MKLCAGLRRRCAGVVVSHMLPVIHSHQGPLHMIQVQTPHQLIRRGGRRGWKTLSNTLSITPRITLSINACLSIASSITLTSYGDGGEGEGWDGGVGGGDEEVA